MPSEDFGLRVKIEDQTQEGFRRLSENAKRYISEMQTPGRYAGARGVEPMAAAEQRQTTAPARLQQQENYKKRREERQSEREESHKQRFRDRVVERTHQQIQEARGGLGEGEQVGSFLAQGGLQQGVHIAMGTAEKIGARFARRRQEVERQRARPETRGPVEGGIPPGLEPPIGRIGGEIPAGRAEGGRRVFRIQSATIQVARGRIAAPGVGVRGIAEERPGMFNRARARVSRTLRGSGEPAGGGRQGLLGKIGAQMSNVAFGVGIAAGIPLAAISAYAGFGKQYLMGQMPTIAGLGRVSGRREGLQATGMSAAQKAQAIMTAQMEMGPEFRVGGVGGVGLYRDNANLFQGAMSRAVRFAAAQGLGGQAGARMFGQVQQFGRYTSPRDVNRDMGRLLGASIEAGVGFRQRGRFVQSAIDITRQQREAGMFQEVVPTGQVMGGLFAQRQNITGMAHAQRVTQQLSQRMGAGLRPGQANIFSGLIAMQALQTKPGIGIFGAMKAAEQGLTKSNLEMLRGTGMFKGEMGKMLLATAGGFRATEAEAIAEGVFGEKAIRGKDMFKGGNFAFNKRIGLAESQTRRAEEAAFREERLGEEKTAQKALDVQIKILKGVDSLVKKSGLLDSVLDIIK